MSTTARRGSVHSATDTAAAPAGATPMTPQALQAMLAAMLSGQLPPGAAQPATKKELKSIAQYLVPVQELPLNAEQKKLVATLAEGAGHPIIAAALRGEKYEDSFMNTLKDVGATNIKVRHVVYAAVAGTVAFLVWEGIAYKFDLPRFGLFDPKNAARR